MPIPVVCPGCKASFNVSDKFAGKQGPCPKCKTVITIPKADQVKKTEEVKIGEPEDVRPGSGPPGKSKTGRPNLKPITRTDLKLSPVVSGVIVVAIIGLFVAAYFARPVVMSPYPLTQEQQRLPEFTEPYNSAMLMAYILRGVGLLLVAMPIAWAGYQVLRDDELEPYSGKSLLIRTAICVFVYLLLWGVYGVIPADYTSAWYMWLVLAPPFFIVGFVTAYYCFELDATSAATHSLFFALVTLLLGMTAGLTMPWYDEPSTLQPKSEFTSGAQFPLYDDSGRPLNDAAKKIEAEKARATAPRATATGS
ncbi:MAG: hypothetical protein JNK76_21155 [Planctomycetales bacterium]|nr:hypothetical protein [Planctomycetales bacterium]MBN8627600.1 hypothetical protein [Planctomycetota bacterium]